MTTNQSTFNPISAKLPHIFYGGDYNPDQWPESVWHEDVQLMQEAGVNLVSLGIFSWARIEPRPGQYDFAWLDQIMDLLHEHGVRVDLATATASPPPWLAKLHPDSLPVTKDGVTLWPGARQAYCPSSSAYRTAAKALVTHIAQRYKNHPALVMWHINNEYACHVNTCYCDGSAQAFRTWLQRRYGTIEALNNAWGTAFWSQHYADWDEINPPRTAPAFANPTQQLDFRRFSSDTILECFQMERDILRQITPDIPVTTNFMGFFKPLDYWKWAKQEDVVSDDAYPDPSDANAVIENAIRFDLMRSLGGGKPWMLMEQTPSQVNWRPVNVLKRPSQMRALSYQAISRGADAVLFFQWRAAKAGAEKFHGGLVPHVGTENSRVWREVKDFGNELKTLDAIVGSRIKADVAILHDWESWWGLELDSKPSTRVNLRDQVMAYYEPLYRRNITVDLAHPETDLSQYRLVIAPNLYMVRDSAAENLERYVANGGTLVMGFFSGIVDEHDHIRLGGYPAPFRKLLGIRIEEFDPYVPGQTNQIRVPRRKTKERAAYPEGYEGRTSDDAERVYSCELWSDLIDLEGAEALATFVHDFYAGRPAVTVHKFGQGTSYYVGTRPEPAFMHGLLQQACTTAKIEPTLETPSGVEAMRRHSQDGSFLFVLNQVNQPAEIKLASAARDLLTGNQVKDTLQLQAFGVAVLEEKAPPQPILSHSAAKSPARASDSSG